MKSLFQLLVIASLVSISQINAATPTPVATGGQRIGDFQFITPDQKKENQMFKVGDVLRVEWKVAPTSMPRPPNVTISIRYGAWPSVSEWQVIADQIPNEEYFDWEIPENQFPHRQYIFELKEYKTPQAWVRGKTTENFVQIYSGTPIIDGEVVFNSGSEQLFKYAHFIGVSMISAMLCVLYAF